MLLFDIQFWTKVGTPCWCCRGIMLLRLATLFVHSNNNDVYVVRINTYTSQHLHVYHQLGNQAVMDLVEAASIWWMLDLLVPHMDEIYIFDRHLSVASNLIILKQFSFLLSWRQIIRTTNNILSTVFSYFQCSHPLSRVELIYKLFIIP
jgi:hypothetical protein